MLEFSLEKADIFKKIISNFKEMVTDVIINFNTNGFSIEAMDASHVSLLKAFFQAEKFERYRCDQPVNIGINLNSLHKILNCADNSDRLKLKHLENSDEIALNFINDSRTTEFSLKLIDIQGDVMGLPDTKYDGTIQLSSNDFKKICQDLSIFGNDILTITMTKKKVIFTSNVDTANAKIILETNKSKKSDEKKEDDIKIIYEENDALSVTFALKYLILFAKSSNVSPKITLSLNLGQPMLAEFQCDLAIIRYYLAPKMDDDDEDTSTKVENHEDIKEEKEEPQTKGKGKAKAKAKPKSKPSNKEEEEDIESENTMNDDE
jgi:proliferating cell nuclear antigen